MTAKKQSIYTIVYNHPKTTSLKGRYKENEYTKDFRNQIGETTSWRFDVTDDPSFYCQLKGKGPLTWGICRPDVRTKLQEGDIVVFICYDEDNYSYYLSAIATVADKIRQTDIWTENKYSHFKEYFNIIIKKTESGSWYHEEPLPNEKNLHSNWDIKILKKIPKPEFTFSDNTISPAYEIEANYIIFSTSEDKTYILKNQLILAEYKKEVDKKKEIWLNTKESLKIFEFIFKSHRSRISFKVHERNQSHVKVRKTLSEDIVIKWRSDFISYLRSIDNK
jgi:hypothetical protein